MGKASRRKALKHPKKIRIRSDQELAATAIAYKNLFKVDPFLANLMLLCSELSEFVPIDLRDEKKLKVFIEENMGGLVFQFVRRFEAVDAYALPMGFLDPPVAAGRAGGMGRA